jgi:hypothetical protein
MELAPVAAENRKRRDTSEHGNRRKCSNRLEKNYALLLQDYYDGAERADCLGHAYLWDLTVTAFTLLEKEQEQQFIFQDAAELYSAVENLLKGPLCRTPYLLGKVVRNFSQLLSRLRFLRFGAECAKRAKGLTKLGI